MKKILVLGGRGLIGSRFIELNSEFKIDAPRIDELDILDEKSIVEYLKNSECEVVLNLAAYTNVDDAEKEKDDKQSFSASKSGIVYRLNTKSVQILAENCKKLNKHLVHFSTSYVFDGKKKDSPYKEKDKKNPLGWYAVTKQMADEMIKMSGCKYSIIRIEMPYRSSYSLKRDIARFFLEELKNNREITAVRDQKMTPGFVDDIVTATEKIITERAEGEWHIGSTDFTTPFDFANLIAEVFNLNKDLVKEVSFEDYHKERVAPRSQHSWLDTSKFVAKFGQGILHTNKESIEIFKKQIDPDNTPLLRR